MLVFDITNRESFTHIHKWFQQASEVKFSYMYMFVIKTQCCYMRMWILLIY